MNFGTPSKFDFARQIGAAMGYVAMCGFDRVAVNVFPGPEVREPGGRSPEGRLPQSAIEGALRSVRGKKSAMPFFRNLASLTASGAADFNGALKRGGMEARQAGVAVVLSDFLDPAGYDAGLNALVGRGFQIHAIQILAPEELEPTAFGDLRLVDAESGAEQEVTFGKYRLKAYQQTVANFVQRLREYCAGRGIRFFSVSSATDLGELLLKQLRASEVWG